MTISVTNAYIKNLLHLYMCTSDVLFSFQAILDLVQSLDSISWVIYLHQGIFILVFMICKRNMKGIKIMFNKSSWKKSWGDKSEKRGGHFFGTSQSIHRVGKSRFRYIWGSLTHKAQRGGGPSCWKIIIDFSHSFPIEGLQTTLTCSNEQIYPHIIPQWKTTPMISLCNDAAPKVQFWLSLSSSITSLGLLFLYTWQLSVYFAAQVKSGFVRKIIQLK